MEKLAHHLDDTGSLRAEVPVDHARDTLWTLTSPEMYELLVLNRVWSIDRYRDWIIRAIIAELSP